jgi:hypothetical protein
VTLVDHRCDAELGRVIVQRRIVAGLDETHRSGWILGESSGEHAPGAAGADDDRVEAFAQLATSIIAVRRWPTGGGYYRETAYRKARRGEGARPTL